MDIKKLERIFGKEFVESYFKAIAEAQKISKEKLEEIKRFAVKVLPNSKDFRVKYDKYDVIMVQVPRIPEVKRTSSGNFKVGLIWAGAVGSISGPWVSAFFGNEEEARKVASRPEEFFLLVGKVRTRQYMGGETYSINVVGVIELTEEEASQFRELE